MNRTVDTLVAAIFFDDARFVSPGAWVDFGLDLNPSLFEVYQRAVKSGVSAQQLHEAAGDGQKLSLLIGEKVETMWDSVQFDS